MTTSEFRKQGYKVIDWLVDYYENIENYVIDNEYTSSECSNNSFDSEDSDERKDS